MAAVSLLLVNWLTWQNKLDTDHQAYAMADAMASLATALDHYGHAELQLATPGVLATQRELTATEITAFRNHSAIPPWLAGGYDDLTASWDIHYLVYYPAASRLPWMILNLEPQGGQAPELITRIRNQLTGRYPALVSGGQSSVREGFTGNVRILAGNIRGSTLAEDDLAFFTWPLSGINTNWLARVKRAGDTPGAMATDLDFGGSHDLTGLATITTETMHATGDLVPDPGVSMNVNDLTVAGDGTVIDLTVNGGSTVTGGQTIANLTTRDMTGIASLEGQSSLSALRGVMAELENEGNLRITGDMTASGTSFLVDGDVTTADGFGRTLDTDMNLSFDSLEVRGFYQVDDDATVTTVTITSSGTCIGCQFSAF